MAMWKGLAFWRHSPQSRTSATVLDFATVERLEHVWQRPDPPKCEWHVNVPLFTGVARGEYYCPLCRAEREQHTDPMQPLRPFHHWRYTHPESRMTEQVHAVKKPKR